MLTATHKSGRDGGRTHARLGGRRSLIVPGDVPASEGIRRDVVLRARRRLALGYYENPALLDVAVERMVAQWLGAPRGGRGAPGRSAGGTGQQSRRSTRAPRKPA